MRTTEAIDRVRAYARQHQLFENGDSLLLAVSGGRDSMAMLHLMRKLDEVSIAVAHMDFQLRGQESEDDAIFVQQTCQSLGVRFFVKRVDCQRYATDHGLSVQEAARELRYTWFETLAREHSMLICTGHHQDDTLETYFINLLRGTGIKGLRGIPIKRDNVIRPMMCFTSDEIGSLAEQEKIKFREDSSNSSDKYLRNRIRHELLPLLDSIKSDGRESMRASIGRIDQQWSHIADIEQWLMTKFVEYQNGDVAIDLDKLASLPSSNYLLYVFLRQYGVNQTQAIDLLHAHSGRTATSPTHKLLKDRNRLLITPLEKVAEPVRFELAIGAEQQTVGGIIKIQPSSKQVEFIRDPYIEVFDADRISGTLTVRNWAAGDRMRPIGMKGTQKISDILINRKVPQTEKERILVLCDEEKIIWLIGHAISEDAKLTDQTIQFLKASWTPLPA